MFFSHPLTGFVDVRLKGDEDHIRIELGSRIREMELDLAVLLEATEADALIDAVTHNTTATVGPDQALQLTWGFDPEARNNTIAFSLMDGDVRRLLVTVPVPPSFTEGWLRELISIRSSMTPASGA